MKRIIARLLDLFRTVKLGKEKFDFAALHIATLLNMGRRIVGLPASSAWPVANGPSISNKNSKAQHDQAAKSAGALFHG
jgi:hypothetical protein